MSEIRIIYGCIGDRDDDGYIPDSVYAGSEDFSVVKTGTGIFIITFDIEVIRHFKNGIWHKSPKRLFQRNYLKRNRT